MTDRLVEQETERGADVEMVKWAEGLFVGSLTDAEMAAFDRLVAAHLAYRSYEGAGGFMGLAKVRFV